MQILRKCCSLSNKLQKRTDPARLSTLCDRIAVLLPWVHSARTSSLIVLKFKSLGWYAIVCVGVCKLGLHQCPAHCSVCHNITWCKLSSRMLLIVVLYHQSFFATGALNMFHAYVFLNSPLAVAADVKRFLFLASRRWSINFGDDKASDALSSCICL